MYPCPKDTLSIQAATLCWAVFPVLYSSSLLVMHVKYIQSSAHNTSFKPLLRPSEKPVWTHTQPLATPGLAGWVILVSIPASWSIALITPSKSSGSLCRAPRGAICMEPRADLPRPKQASLWCHESGVLGLLQFPLFLKAFFEPNSLLWTPTGSWSEASTLCQGWAVTVHPWFTLASNLPIEGSSSPTHREGTGT